MDVRPLQEGDTLTALDVLARALPHDRIDVVGREKLWGDNGVRTGRVLGAFHGALLVGVAATAGRWLKLLGVDPPAQRRGIGSRLLDEARKLTRRGLRVFDHPGNYLSPGLDVRYDAGLAFVGKHGFQVTGEVENLRAPLDGNPLLTAARREERLLRCTQRGYRVARVAPGEERVLLDWVAAAFAAVWANEVARALEAPRRAVHAAWHNDRPVAFAAADGNNQGLGWFGPAGTDAEHRGRGLGEALLHLCLDDVRGLPEAGVIAWIGPRAFYERTIGARHDRRFLTLEEP
jgi:ribosomal protein S18 acetylase RimI-like enzyme